PPDKFLHAMVLGISHVKIPRGIECHAPRVAKVARGRARTSEHLEELVVCVENLDAAVAKFANVLPACTVDANIIWITEFALTLAALAVRPDEFAFAREDLDAMVARIGNIKPV